MTHFCIPEYGRIPRTELPDRVLGRLQKFDERVSKSQDGPVFDWSRLQYVRATSYVGVVQVPGVSVEILPKIDAAGGDNAFGAADPLRDRVQNNLLYMLSLTRDLPLEERDLADQKLRRLPLLERLIQIFLRRILTEMRRGLDQWYVRREENLPVLKGKLLTTEHVRLNIARQDRFYVGYDEFVADTLLNRILKATCRRLLEIGTHATSQQLAREALLDLADVEDVAVRLDHFANVQLTRSSERFRVLLNFCRLVLIEATPSPSVGGANTFSLLFPMEQLFEQFVGAFIRRHAEQLGTHRNAVHVQAVHHHRWLLTTPSGSGRFRMRPDILITRSGGSTRLVLDTKWKRLKRDAEDRRNGVAQGDVYQLYAYAHRYASPDNVLLYPRVPGVTPKEYRLQDALRRTIRVEFLDLNRDLATLKSELVTEMRDILRLGQEHRSQPVVASSVT